MKKLLVVLLILFAGNLKAQTGVQTAGVVGRNIINRTYLGFGSANTAKTTGAIAITASTAGHNIYAVGCSGNFATTSWTAAITDSASNTYVQLGATSGTYPQANSTTQVCVPFISVAAAKATTITFTISGTNSANTTVSVMAWDIGNALPNLGTVDGFSGAGQSAVTAITSPVLIPSQANELIIAAGCMSTGTITLTTGSGLVFDSGSQAIASGANIASCFGGSAVVSQPVGATGAFTDGSSASGSEVVIAFRSYATSDAGLQHISGNMLNAQARGNYANQNPAMVTPPAMWMQSNNPGSAATASTSVAGAVGKIRVVTGWCFGMGVGTTALAGATSETFTVTDGSTGAFFSVTLTLPITVGTLEAPPCVTGVAIPITAGQSVTAAFGGNLANLLEWVSIFGYDVAQTGIVY